MRDLNFSVALTCRQNLECLNRLLCATDFVGTHYFARAYREHYLDGNTSAANLMINDALISDDKVRWEASL